MGKHVHPIWYLINQTRKTHRYMQPISISVSVVYSIVVSDADQRHDIITRDANSVSWAEIWECSKSQRDIINAVTISKKMYLS